MLVKRPRGWEIKEARATDEAVFRNRRRFIRQAAAGAMLVGAPLLLTAAPAGMGRMRAAEAAAAIDPRAALYPVARNERYVAGRAITPEGVNATYNNFYEFGSHKQIWKAAQALKTQPWQIVVDGMVEKKITIDVDDLVKRMTLEERVYRHRCVEAWAMVVPWSGFALKELVDLARPLASAKYVRFETFLDRSVAHGQKQTWYPWPYVEGITVAEATNELAFMVTGAYGKPVANQFGAPIRLHLPWKYGFKSVKSIARIEFTDQRPVSFWQQIQAGEYGFWANVNPAVHHPRWSQASERLLGSNEQVPTQLFNGYGEFVADLYKGLEREPLYT